jgi:hypothetical protein
MSQIPYGSIPRNEILQIEKQILRDMAAMLKHHLTTIRSQAPSQYLHPIVNAAWEINRIAEDLERLAE